MSTEPLDLDEAAAILADNGIDGPDLPYNPRALAAMRTADALLAELVQARAEIERAGGRLANAYDGLTRVRNLETGKLGADDAIGRLIDMYTLHRLAEKVYAYGYDDGYLRGYDEGCDGRQRPNINDVNRLREAIAAERSTDA